MVDTYCKGCVYLVRIYYGRGCNYSEVNGHIRGCPSGNGCTRRQYGKKKRRPSAFSFGSSSSTETQRTAPSPKKPPETKEEYNARRRLEKQQSVERIRSRLNGRQKAVIKAYKDETGYTNRKISELLGVSESTVQKWASEFQSANWDLLKTLGITKPEGID